jgi:ATP phosphoribosyltransferase
VSGDGERGIRLALPRGDFRAPIAERLEGVGLHVEGYGEGSRQLRLDVAGEPEMVVRVFADRDIPIQVALGQYDLGIASRAWIDELLVRYGRDSIVPVLPLDLDSEAIAVGGTAESLEAVVTAGVVRVATEYPNLAHAYLNRRRVPDYRVYDVWARAEAWPPDDADLAIGPRSALAKEGLPVLEMAHAGGVWLIGNREALATRDLRAALEPLQRLPRGEDRGGLVAVRPLVGARRARPAAATARDTLRIAVPDGHAQRHTVEALTAAGIAFEGYDESSAVRRPTSTIDGVEVKVMRPQDMPRAVALGAFDLALTGRDWLAAHLAAFPSSPVVELCDLRRSKYRMGAVVSEDLPAETIGEAIAYWRRDDPDRPIRVASEYVALADDYARSRHLGRYQVIPISGASEGFVPEDAEILIEGTETGSTLRANRLRMIDVTMESTNCAVGAPVRPAGRRGALRDELVERLARAAEESADAAAVATEAGS